MNPNTTLFKVLQIIKNNPTINIKIFISWQPPAKNCHLKTGIRYLKKCVQLSVTEIHVKSGQYSPLNAIPLVFEKFPHENAISSAPIVYSYSCYTYFNTNNRF